MNNAMVKYRKKISSVNYNRIIWGEGRQYPTSGVSDV